MSRLIQLRNTEQKVSAVLITAFVSRTPLLTKISAVSQTPLDTERVLSTGLQTD